MIHEGKSWYVCEMVEFRRGKAREVGKEELVTTHAQRTAQAWALKQEEPPQRVRLFVCCNPILTVGLRPKAAVRC